MDVGVLDYKVDRLGWKLDVSTIEVLRDELLKTTFADFQLFFNSNHMSEPMRLTHKQGKEIGASEQPSSISVETIKSFIQGVSSRRTIFVRGAELLVNDGFPHTTANVKWNSVFDGKELVICEVERFEILGEAAAFLAEPQYSWVLTFENCKDIAISDLTVGHISAVIVKVASYNSRMRRHKDQGLRSLWIGDLRL